LVEPHPDQEQHFAIRADVCRVPAFVDLCHEKFPGLATNVTTAYIMTNYVSRDHLRLHWGHVNLRVEHSCIAAQWVA
jgi:hypothetical protein